MANLKEVKNRIQSVNSTQQITKAMKMVAAARLRKAQENILQIRPYVQKLNVILDNIAEGMDSDDHATAFSEKREVKSVLVIVISSDRGLCGAFNNATFKYAMQTLDDTYSDLAKENISIMPIGKKAYEYFRRIKAYNLVEDYAFDLKTISFDTFKPVAEYAMDEFLNKTYDKVVVVYNEFKNVATQVLKADQFLPFKQVSPTSKTDIQTGNNTDHIFSPDKEDLFRSLIPKALKVTFYKTILESAAAEMGARMTAMDKATDNANELLKELKLTYNRTRQAAITNEILEIVGGAEALGNS